MRYHLYGALQTLNGYFRFLPLFYSAYYIKLNQEKNKIKQLINFIFSNKESQQFKSLIYLGVDYQSLESDS